MPSYNPTSFLPPYPLILRKSILSPKYIFSVPQSLSPGVNLRIYHHSAETETHIHFSFKIAETFDLLGFSRQKAHSLHMSRVGIMHSQLHNYLHCLKCNLFICLSTHYAGLALISTKKSFQQFRIHSSPKHVQRIKTRKKAFEHCVFLYAISKVSYLF